MKDLAKEYADLQCKIQQDTPEESPDLSKGIFGHEDLVNAFNAGRESIVEDIPGLVFKECADMGVEYIAETIFDYSYRINKKLVDGLVSFGFSAGLAMPHNYDTSLTKVINDANADYRSALRRCLMLDIISEEELEQGLEVKFIHFLNKVRNDRLRNEHFTCGYANGYVAVPPHHPLWGMFYDQVNELVSVHGGLTYSRAYNERLVSNAILLSEDEIPADSWVFGFDTMHLGDNLENCSEEFCKSETINLVEQFKKIKL